MLLGIISDSHDNLPNIYQALDYFKQQGIDTVIHCGDVCAPGVMREIVQKFGGRMHLVYGNVDGDREKMEALAESLPNLTIHGEQGRVEIDGKKIGFVHYPDVAETMAKKGDLDAVFYGHDHKPWEKQIGKTTLRNPGTLAGLFAKATFATYDTQTNKAKLILVETLSP